LKLVTNRYYDKMVINNVFKFDLSHLVPRRPFENAFRSPLTSHRIFSTIPPQFSAASARDFIRSATNDLQIVFINTRYSLCHTKSN